MSSETLQDLNEKRSPKHLKSLTDESFLSDINSLLQTREIQTYQDVLEEFPIFFVIGVPRSGTTLTAQLIAHGLDVGYMNNFMARFWLAPVTGIKLSQIIFGDADKKTDFQSRYATTAHVTDLHAFGYFWRHWFRKEKLTDFVRAGQDIDDIDWDGLRRTLLNIQHEFGKPVLFKNLFGAYYIEQFLQLLEKVVFIYIERDPVDSAISILNARKNYYTDPNLWWSTVPLEYEQLKDLSAAAQVAGQVYFLRKLYRQQINAVKGERIISIRYRDLCDNPLVILEQIQQKCQQWFGLDIQIAKHLPKKFTYRQYDDPQQRAKFQQLLMDFEQQDSRS